jgi:hypothetical protein
MIVDVEKERKVSAQVRERQVPSLSKGETSEKACSHLQDDDLFNVV